MGKLMPYGHPGWSVASRRHWAGLAVALVAAVFFAACGGGAVEERAAEAERAQTATERTQPAEEFAGVVTENNLPAGFEKTPTMTVAGKQMKFDDIPGHYWKVLDEQGFSVGLHFQSDQPFKWAQDVPTGELLYIVYAIPGSCPGANFGAAVESPNASVIGALPSGFDHWHALVGGGTENGHWLMHIPVRDFTFAGMAGNPFEGRQVRAGDPGFIPVCEPR